MKTGEKTILLVEDEQIIALEEKNTLTGHGFNVIIAGSGEEAIETFRSTDDISIILMDIDLGSGMDGTQAAQIILSERHIPIIFLSSHTELEFVEKTEGITSYGYVVKGCNETVLLASISMAFRLYNEKIKRKESETALESEKIRFENMAKSVPGVLCSILVNPYGYKEFYYTSPQTEHFFGFTFEELKRDSSLFFGRIDSDNLKVLDESLLQSMENMTPVKIHLVYKHPGNSEIYLKCNFSPTIHDKNNILFHGFITDTTDSRKSQIALERSEENYRNLINGMSETIWILDFDGNIIDINNMVPEVTGMTREEFIGHNISEIDKNFTKKEILNLIKYLPEEKVQIFETFHSLKNGKVIPVEIYSSLTYYNGVHSILSIARDISRRKDAEEKLKVQIEEKEVLLKTAHHRIKNNLAAIASLISLQANSINDEKSKSILKDAQGRINCIHVLYDSLLRTGNYINLEIGDYIRKICESVISIFTEYDKISFSIGGKSFKVTTKSLFPLGVIIEELITNIMKYAFEDITQGKIEIFIQKNNNFAIIQIKDNGRGIPDSTVKKDLSGFGLTIVNVMTKQLGGEFEIKNINGTLCTLKFPVSKISEK